MSRKRSPYNPTRAGIVRTRATLRARFGDAYSKLETLLFEEDPMGINLGDNTDEYDPEVRTILPKLASCRTTDEVQTLVHAEFSAWFAPGSAGPRKRYARIAERIVAELPGAVPSHDGRETMTTKNLARTVIEGGQHARNKNDRRLAAGAFRVQTRAYLAVACRDPEAADAVAPRSRACAE